MILGFLLAARAELPPPDYRAGLHAQAAEEVKVLAAEKGLEAAGDFVTAWEREIGDAPDVLYELALANRGAGKNEEARELLDRVIERDSRHAAARYDRGELLLSEGEIEAAKADFQVVVAEEPEAWAGHFRLADVAARTGDVPTFEAELLLALRHGFEFRAVVGDRRWKGYLKDPSLGPVLEKLLVVYQDPAVLQEMMGE